MKTSKQTQQLRWEQKVNCYKVSKKETAKNETIFKYQYTAEDKASSAVYFFTIKQLRSIIYYVFRFPSKFLRA